MKAEPKYSARVEPVPNPAARIALLGEALGAEELAQKKYFCGKAGRHLDSVLTSAGLSRSHCYITNVVKEQPPKTKRKTNDFSVFLDFYKKPPFESPEYKLYVEELKAEFAQLPDINVIVCLGASATYAALGLSENPLIRKRRGSIYWSSVLQKKVICTLHPASILYAENGAPWWTKTTNVLANYMLIYDLIRAKGESEFPELRLKEREMLIRPTFNEAVEFLQLCINSSEVAFDIETLGAHLSCFSVAPTSTLSMCIPVAEGTKSYWNPDQELEITLLTAKLLEQNKTEILIQNAMFDCKFMFRRYGISTSNIYDTLIAQSVLTPDYKFPREGLGKDLGTLVSIHCDGEPYYKEDGKMLFKDQSRILKLLNYDYTVFWQYSCKDTLVLHDIKAKQVEELKFQNNWETYERQVAQVLPAIFMGEFGQRIDTEALKNAKPLVDAKVAQLRNEFKALTKSDINVNSTKQLQVFFYIDQKVTPFKKRRASGQSTITLDEKALQRIAAGGGKAKQTAQKAAQLLLKIRKFSKLSSTYMNIEVSADGRLRYDLNPAGTTSGRYSSDKNLFGEGQNSQNLAKDDYEIEVEE